MLERLGWTPAFEDQFAPHAADGLEPARVAVEHRGAYLLYTSDGERPAELSGRLRHAVDSRGELPAVGDWVAVADPEGADKALVQAVLPRRTKFSRMAANDHGQTIEQVVAANVDVVSSSQASTATSRSAGSSGTSPSAGRAAQSPSSS